MVTYLYSKFDVHGIMQSATFPLIVCVGRVCLQGGGRSRLPDLHSQPQGRADPGADQGQQVLVCTPDGLSFLLKKTKKQ